MSAYMRFDDRLFERASTLVWDLAQQTSDANGAPVALLERGGWLAICEEPPDDMESAPIEHGWTLFALIEPDAHEFGTAR